MAINEYDEHNASEEKPNTADIEEPIPIGIARIRKEWREFGLVEDEVKAHAAEDMEQVVFPEVDGGAGIGDYTLDCSDVRARLALSEDAVDRLISSGELDSILVAGADGSTRRMISEASMRRFEEDAAIDPDAMRRAAKAMADKGVAEAIDDLQTEINELRNTQSKILQQMKDMLLLEVRNLKEQDRDLTSFVYELAEEIRAVLPRKRK